MNTLTVVFLVLALGYLLGRVTVKGLNLGTSAIIIVALVFGHFGYSVPKEIQNFGLALFVTAVGFIAGPVFFRNFKKKAVGNICIGLLIPLLGGLICIGAIKLLGIPTALAAGMMCGALTSTPGLAAAVEASGDAAATVGYGIAYPFGVIGVVLFVQLIPKLTKCDIRAELAALTPAAARAVSDKPLLRLDGFGFAPFMAAAVLGTLLGSVSVPLPGGASFSLGISGGPLLAGLVFGHFEHIGRVDISVPKATLNVARELGLALFLMGAGLSAGNGFVAILREHGAGLFAAGIVMTLAPMVIGYLAALKLFRTPPFTALGSICGGMTSTPALGCLIATAKSDMVAASYAATYPVALIFVVLTAQFICLLF